MKIVVCVKQVPDTETRIRIAPEGNAIVEADVNWIVSPYDEFAIEEALRIREKKGGEVVLVTAGPERAQSALRTGLAMGADSAVHVKDPLVDGTDTLGTARALAAAIKTLAPFDLVLTGQQGVGGDNSQVPGLLAELLDLPQVTVAVKLEIGDGKAVVEREIEGAHETWETSLPAVVSAQKGLNEPRYASLKGIMAAKKKTIDVKAAAALGLDAAALAPRTKVTALELPPPRPAVRMIEGDADTQVKELLRLLHEEAKVI
jgi:electron transfer flavoprotein beta subunit